jgi:hypothetical protein
MGVLGWFNEAEAFTEAFYSILFYSTLLFSTNVFDDENKFECYSYSSFGGGVERKNQFVLSSVRRSDLLRSVSRTDFKLPGVSWLTGRLLSSPRTSSMTKLKLFLPATASPLPWLARAKVKE